MLFILAVVLIGVAAFFLWRGYGDGAFAAAVLGCVAFFLNIRYQVKKRVEKRNADILEGKYGRGLPDSEADHSTDEYSAIPEPRIVEHKIPPQD